MMVHCLNQELEGMKDFIYYRKKYGKYDVNIISHKALKRFKSWNMVAYKIKQHFEK